MSPLACSPDLWQGAPPVYFALGEEALTDEDLLTARKIHRAGVSVIAEQYEGMPHLFSMIMMRSVAAGIFFQGLAQFCRDAVAGSIGSGSSRDEVGNLVFHNAGWKSTRLIPLDEVHALSDADVEKRMRDSQRKRMEWERKHTGEWRAKALL